MNRLLVFALVGAALYWLFKEPVPSRPRLVLADSDLPLDLEDEQALLDEALEESFPASDPPAVSPRRH